MLQNQQSAKRRDVVIMTECNHVWDETYEVREKLISQEKFGKIIERGWVNRCVKCGKESLRTTYVTGKLFKSEEVVSESSFYDRHFGDIMACIIGGYLLMLLGLLLMMVF